MTEKSAPPSSTMEVVIEPSRGWLRVPWRELWEYRDLFWQFVRRDFATKYRQTLLGPFWFILQPLLMTAVLTVVFGRIARLPTDGVPPVLFYLCGLLSWTYFAQTMPAIAATFTANSQLFAKVYFPRLVIPFAQVAGNLAALGLQFLTFCALWIFYRAFTDFGLHPVSPIIPALGMLLLAQVQIMLLALGVGTLLAAATGKYRDLQHALPILVQLWFYATPIVYPLSMISPEANWRWVATLNPLTAPVEAFKYALLNQGSWSPQLAAGAWAVTLAILATGLAAYSRTERTIVDVA